MSMTPPPLHQLISPNWAKVLIVLGVLYIMPFNLLPFAIVPAGHRGVVTTFGKVDQDVRSEGLQFVTPFAQKMHLINVQIQKGEGEGDAASKDLQSVHTRVAINYHIQSTEAAKVYQAIGTEEEIADRIIVPATQEAVRAATAQYTAEELITKRAAVRDRIRSILDDRLRHHSVVVDEFSIINFLFSKGFTEAIEAKTTAEQLKLKAERDLERIRVEAEQKIAQAKAEAESLRLQKQEVTAELVRLREIENQKRAIEKWNGVLPQVTGQSGMPFIDLRSHPHSNSAAAE
jgi:prohibitin 2